MRRVVTLGLAAAVLIGGTFLLRSVAALAETVQIWRGYYTLVVTGDAAELVRRLQEAEIGAVIAASSATELLTTFRGFESVPVADLQQRLDPLDPRYDPYLRHVGNWFADPSAMRDVSFVYVGSVVPPGYFAARVGGVLSGIDAQWHFGGLPWEELFLALLLAAAGMALQIFLRDGRTPRGWQSVLAVPWLFLVAQGGLPVAFVAVPAHCAVVRLAGAVALRRAVLRRPPAWRWPWHGALRGAVLRGVTLLGALIVVAATVAERTAAVPVIERMALHLAIGTIWCAVLAACAWLPPRRAATERYAGAAGHAELAADDADDTEAATEREDGAAAHGPSPAPRLLAARLARSLLMVLIAVAILLGGGRRVPRPDPPAEVLPVTLEAISGAGRLASTPPRWSEDPPVAPGVPARFQRAAGTPLPALTDFVTHLAYQETLPFARPYRLPAPDERVVLADYRRAIDGRVVREERVVARFDEGWLREAVAAVPPVSIAAVLLAQDGLVAARYEPPQRSTGELVLWISLALSLAVWMLVPGRAGGDAEKRSAAAPPGP